MAKKTHMHLPDDSDKASRPSPRSLTKQEFSQRLYNMMLKKGWHQSELSRRSGIPRDSISTYVRGVVYPTPVNLQKLATALEVEPFELLPNHAENAIRSSDPAFELTVTPENPRLAWLRVNRLVTSSTAVKIAELLEADDALDRVRSS